jgi:hypothetical protein
MGSEHVRVQIEFVVLESIDSLLLTHFGILELGSCGAAEDIPNLSCIGSAPTALTQQLGSHIYGDLDDPLNLAAVNQSLPKFRVCGVNGVWWGGAAQYSVIQPGWVQMTEVADNCPSLS